MCANDDTGPGRLVMQKAARPELAPPAEPADPRLDLRIATGADTADVVALYDQAVAWLAARGRSSQWGTTPFSARPDVTALIRARAESGDMWVAQAPGHAPILGAIVLSREAPHYVHRAARPEIYISGFITSRSPRARGAGPLLLEHAKATARAAGIDLLRLDCYAGGDGALVAYYESAGFRLTGRFTVDLMGSAYSGCLLQQRLAPAGAARGSPG